MSWVVKRKKDLNKKKSFKWNRIYSSILAVVLLENCEFPTFLRANWNSNLRISRFANATCNFTKWLCNSVTSGNINGINNTAWFSLRKTFPAIVSRESDTINLRAINHYVPLKQIKLVRNSIPHCIQTTFQAREALLYLKNFSGLIIKVCCSVCGFVHCSLIVFLETSLVAFAFLF